MCRVKPALVMWCSHVSRSILSMDYAAFTGSNGAYENPVISSHATIYTLCDTIYMALAERAVKKFK